MFRAAYGCTQHGADKQRWGKHATGSAADEGKQGGNDLESGEDGQHLPGELAVHGFVHVLVAGSHDLRRTQDTDESDQQTCDGGLKILGPARQRLEPGTQHANAGGKRHRSQTADDPKDGIGDEFRGMLQLHGGDSEERLGAEKPAHDHDAGYGGENYRAEDAGGPAADDLFDHEEYGRDRRVEGGGQSGGGTNGRDQAHSLPG